MHEKIIAACQCTKQLLIHKEGITEVERNSLIGAVEKHYETLTANYEHAWLKMNNRFAEKSVKIADDNIDAFNTASNELKSSTEYFLTRDYELVKKISEPDSELPIDVSLYNPPPITFAKNKCAADHQK